MQVICIITLFPLSLHELYLAIVKPAQYNFLRRSLEECPQLGVGDGLQLLSLQHNLITRIQHLSHLQQLVFLNLADNHITEMTGVEALSSLRILLLGKNRSVIPSD